jgi:hypothetical protein
LKYQGIQAKTLLAPAEAWRVSRSGSSAIVKVSYLPLDGGEAVVDDEHDAASQLYGGYSFTITCLFSWQGNLIWMVNPFCTPSLLLQVGKPASCHRPHPN